jgi:hypothetical protein
MKIVFIAVLSGIFAFSQVALAIASDKQTVGWTEIVRIFPGSMKVKAKLDTGADNSSLNAKDVEYFTRGGERWVRFRFRNFEDCYQVIEAKTIRTAAIKRLGQEAADRPVIRLGICMGGTYKEAEVNLTNRSRFNYQMLVGRSFMAGSFLVDPELRFYQYTGLQRLGESMMVP